MTRSGEVVVRPVTPADAEAIARVHWQSWRETYTGLVPEDRLGQAALQRRREQWGSRLGRPLLAGESGCRDGEGR